MITFFSKAMMKRKAREEKGFTLIELVVVISILGILAAMAVPRLSDFTGQARVAANQGTSRSILSTAVAIEAEFGDTIASTVTYDTNHDGTVDSSDEATLLALLNTRVPNVTIAATAASGVWGVAPDANGNIVVTEPTN